MLLPWWRKLARCVRKPFRLRPSGRSAPALRLEVLEDRTVPATLDVTGRALSFTDLAGETNNLMVSVANNVYTFNDSGAPITLTAGAIAAGFTGDGTNTVSGPDDAVDSIAIDVADAEDVVTIDSINDPTTVLAGSGDDVVNVLSTDARLDIDGVSDSDTVVIGNTLATIDQFGFLADINGPVNVANTGGFTALTVDGSGDPAVVVDDVPFAATITATGITGLSPAPITYVTADLASLTVFAGSDPEDPDTGVALGNSIDVDLGGAAFPTELNSGVGDDIVNVFSTTGTLDIKGQNGFDFVTIGNDFDDFFVDDGSLANIRGAIDVSNAGFLTCLTIDGALDPRPATTVMVSNTQVTGLAPASITFTGNDLDRLIVIGSNSGAVYTVTDTYDNFRGDGSTLIFAGSGVNEGTIGIDTINVLKTTGALAFDLTNSPNAIDPSIPANFRNDDTVILGNDLESYIAGRPGSAAEIRGAVSISSTSGFVNLIVDDSGRTDPLTAAITNIALTGLAPAPVVFLDPFDFTDPDLPFIDDPVSFFSSFDPFDVTGTSPSDPNMVDAGLSDAGFQLFSLTVKAGSGNDVIDVYGFDDFFSASDPSTSFGSTPVFLDSREGADVINVNVTSQATPFNVGQVETTVALPIDLTLNGGGGGSRDVLNIIDVSGGGVIRNGGGPPARFVSDAGTPPPPGTVTVEYVGLLAPSVIISGLDPVRDRPAIDPNVIRAQVSYADIERVTRTNPDRSDDVSDDNRDAKIQEFDRANFVQFLYHDALLRNAAAAETAVWLAVLTATGGNLDLVSSQIELSAEAWTAAVARMYLVNLGRAPVQGEEQFWVSLLLQGHSEEEVRASILSSPEFFLNRAGGDNAQYIRALFFDLLGRQASDMEVQLYANFIMPFLGRFGVAFALQNSAEFRTPVVERFYDHVLDRRGPSMVSPAEIDFWTLVSGLDLARIRFAFTSSMDFEDSFRVAGALGRITRKQGTRGTIP